MRANLATADPLERDLDLAIEWEEPEEPQLFTQQELRWYRDLRVEPGASDDELRRGYRQQMRAFHPDRFANDPEKFEMATKVARGLTEAYNGLLRVRGG